MESKKVIDSEGGSYIAVIEKQDPR